MLRPRPDHHCSTQCNVAAKFRDGGLRANVFRSGNVAPSSTPSGRAPRLPPRRLRRLPFYIQSPRQTLCRHRRRRSYCRRPDSQRRPPRLLLLRRCPSPASAAVARIAVSDPVTTADVVPIPAKTSMLSPPPLPKMPTPPKTPTWLSSFGRLSVLICAPLVMAAAGKFKFRQRRWVNTPPAPGMESSVVGCPRAPPTARSQSNGGGAGGQGGARILAYRFQPFMCSHMHRKTLSSRAVPLMTVLQNRETLPQALQSPLRSSALCHRLLHVWVAGGPPVAGAPPSGDNWLRTPTPPLGRAR